MFCRRSGWLTTGIASMSWPAITKNKEVNQAVLSKSRMMKENWKIKEIEIYILYCAMKCQMTTCHTTWVDEIQHPIVYSSQVGYHRWFNRRGSSAGIKGVDIVFIVWLDRHNVKTDEAPLRLTIHVLTYRCAGLWNYGSASLIFEETSISWRFICSSGVVLILGTTRESKK